LDMNRYEEWKGSSLLRARLAMIQYITNNMLLKAKSTQIHYSDSLSGFLRQ
jgi:hypothetical protein